MTVKISAIALVSGALVLGACTDPASLSDPTNPNRNRDTGVLVGAGIGALTGQLFGGDTKATVIGAAVGGAAGGLIGNQLDKQEAELRASLGDDRVTITNTGDRLIVTLPQDILFATDSFAVNPGLMDDLAAVSRNLQAYPDSTVQVIGHTDNTGDAAYNQSLSERRASAVANVLISSGTPAGRVVPIGRGEDAPVASNLTPEGRAQNRRVEIVILPRG
jgi:outer membrane protein OmpA-like peptidoglycan-associated protein